MEVGKESGGILVGFCKGSVRVLDRILQWTFQIPSVLHKNGARMRLAAMDGFWLGFW